MNNETIDVSILIPVYFNEGTLNTLFEEIYKLVIKKNSSKTFEVIFVDDGSKDQSLNILLQLKNKNPDYIKIIKFTRNCGQANAVTAALELAKGKFAISIDADLQDPPEIMNEMIDAYFNDGFEIAIGIREARKESYYRRTGSFLWYSFLRKITFPEFPKKGFNYFGISEKVRSIILEEARKGTAMSNVLIVWTGFPIKEVLYTRQKRDNGKSQFGILKKVGLMVEYVVSFSFFPIRIMTIMGAILSILGFIYAGMIVFGYLFGYDSNFKGWAPIMILILVIGGFQMLMIGIIGEYLWRTLSITRQRSLYVIEKIFD